MISKRKYTNDEEDEDNAGSDSDAFSVAALSDDEIDISSALTSKRQKIAQNEDDDDDIMQIMAQSIAQRNIKDGTDVVKKAKGKDKLTKGEVGGGSFQSMGLHPSLLRSLTLQGFRIPTPIQRVSIPALLASPPRDLVGMARTGSGKSLAYLVPLVQRLNGRHSTSFGARSLILLPTRELALQVLKVGKELSRGWHSKDADHAGDKESTSSKHSQSLRWGLIVGGEGLDEQFEMITNNPDVIIATPGRLLHLIVEMNLDLKSVQYVVFDEADRLFEMGFETALSEILGRLPEARQTLLFSATLPKSLVEFAKAGLQNPKLLRLDAESKISTDLKMAFFSVKVAEKEACLLSLLRDVIKVPFGSKTEEEMTDKKRKGKGRHPEQFSAPHQTLVFAATKHHVEYLTNLLTTANYSVSHIYGSLDQTARTFQMDQFRRGLTNILVVTDVAARGIDIPVLENVVNYDFPQGARVFVHRVGRTARAGRQGWAWSFITHTELPYLLDLQLFLGRPLKSQVTEDSDQSYTESLILGTFQRDKIDEDMEYLRVLEDVNHSLPSLRQVMLRGHAMYERSKGKASQQSYKRAKEMSKDPKFMLAGSDSGIHPVLLRGDDAVERREQEERRKALLRTVNAFRPTETILEAGGKANAVNAALMKERRKALQKSAERALASTSTAALDEDEDDDEVVPGGGKEVEMADEDEIAAVFDTSNKKAGFRDEEFYMSHYQKDAVTEKGYSLTDGASSFAAQASRATFDLTTDEGTAQRQKNQMTWDKKKKRFIKGDGVGADNVKMVRTESGTKLPATYRSGRFDEWKTKNRVSLPRTGETENEGSGSRGHKFGGGGGGQRFKHNKVTAAKPLDKLSTDYERKSRQFRKRADEEAGGPEANRAGPSGRGRGRGGKFGQKPESRYAGKSVGAVKSELKNAAQVRKERQTVDRKRAKNARPSRGGGGGGRGGGGGGRGKGKRR